MKVGANAYGLQFHIEITGANIEEWHDKYAIADSLATGVQPMLTSYILHKDAFQAQAKRLYENFLVIVNKK